ncbi:MAG TPA: trehalose-6-phosphate synthase [Xanthobacteraceae bacterium]|nr:trehalose-6-phosphate synthase [Xanthobacteraceae bacterium]
MSLVVVSNRIAKIRKDEPLSGGLASALLPVVQSSGAIWVGSSGRLRDASQKDSFAEIEAFGTGAIATVDLPAASYRGFYEGFANSVLWPALHSRPDLIRATQDDYRCYREVNAFMARGLLRFGREDSTYWVHDYHFLALGAELRRLHVTRPLGFFLHTPWPTRCTMLSVPHHRELVEAMLAYDLIGFQTEDDRANFADYVANELQRDVMNHLVTSKRDVSLVASGHGVSRLGVFPIGIDVDAFAARAAKAVTRHEFTRLRTSLHGVKLAIGVDRVDYSKGLENRIRAFDRMLATQPSLRGEVSLLQIAVPSRKQIAAYGQLNHDLATLVGEVNGRHGEVDWVPVRYVNRGYGQSMLAGFYRVAQVGLVTPLHDGMNLVAKEYVAAQNPADPGVLVLSEFAGAAKELDAAVLVNPHDIDGMAQAIARAMFMPAAERRARWIAMIDKLRANSVQRWFADFVATLAETHPATESIALPAPEPTNALTYRPERSAARLS